MSRRLRVEAEREKQLNIELEEEECKLKAQQERIFGPLVWKKMIAGIDYRIEDLKPNYYEEVLDMLEADFVNEDVILKNSTYQEDEESQKAYRERILFNLKDRCSIILIEERRVCKEERLEALECSCESMTTEKEDVLAGVLVLKALKKCDMSRIFSRVQIFEGKALTSIIRFLNYINKKVDIYDRYNCDMYLRYYLLCVKPEHRGKGLGFQLMALGINIANHLNIPIAMGLFNNFRLQKIAKKLKFETLFEVEYIKWVDKTEQLVFCEPGQGNYTCALMACQVPPPPEPEPIIIVEEEPKYKLTRSEKRKKLEKQKQRNLLRQQSRA